MPLVLGSAHALWLRAGQGGLLLRYNGSGIGSLRVNAGSDAAVVTEVLTRS